MPKFSDRVFGSNVDQTTIDIFENLQNHAKDMKKNRMCENRYQLDESAYFCY